MKKIFLLFFSLFIFEVELKATNDILERAVNDSSVKTYFQNCEKIVPNGQLPLYIIKKQNDSYKFMKKLYGEPRELIEEETQYLIENLKKYYDQQKNDEEEKELEKIKKAHFCKYESTYDTFKKNLFLDAKIHINGIGCFLVFPYCLLNFAVSKILPNNFLTNIGSYFITKFVMWTWLDLYLITAPLVIFLLSKVNLSDNKLSVYLLLNSLEVDKQNPDLQKICSKLELSLWNTVMKIDKDNLNFFEDFIISNVNYILINMGTSVIPFIFSLYFSKNNFSIVTYYGIKYITKIVLKDGLNLIIKELIDEDFEKIMKNLMKNFEEKSNIKFLIRTLTKKQTKLFFDEKGSALMEDRLNLMKLIEKCENKRQKLLEEIFQIKISFLR